MLFPVALLCFAAYVLYLILARIRLHRQRAAFKRAHGCEPAVARYPIKDPWGFNLLLELVPAAKRQELLPFFHELHQRYGKTFVHQPWFGRSTVFTIDPENTKTMMATSFDDWVAKDARQEGFGDLLGDGIFTTDGAFWAHSRALIRPQFDKAQVSEQVEAFEDSTLKLIAKIPDDGKTVDLQDLFHRLAMDTSTEFLTGASTDSLSDDQSESGRDFIEAFEYAMNDGFWRVRLGKLYWLRPDPKAPKAIKDCRDYIKSWVNRAVANRDALAAGEKDDTSDGPYIFINELAKQPDVDVERIHNEAINCLLAGRDTTASLLSHLWYVLARRPDVWQKLRAEVDALGSDLPTYAKLKEMRHMRNCLRETLRLYPALPVLIKRAAKDTLLPRGGGKCGDKPLFVAKGTTISPSFWSMQRDKDVFGSDADDFRPERWDEPSLRPFWSYTPFGGGPRACLGGVGQDSHWAPRANVLEGQQYAQSEAMYVTTRLMQHFMRIEPRDAEPLRHNVAATISVHQGVRVALSNAA